MVIRPFDISAVPLGCMVVDPVSMGAQLLMESTEDVQSICPSESLPRPAAASVCGSKESIHDVYLEWTN